MKVVQIFNPNYSYCFPTGCTRKIWCLIWYLNESRKPTRLSSWQSSLKMYRPSQQRISESWWRRTTAILLGVSFGTYRRRRRDVAMGRRGYVPLRRIGDVPLRLARVSFETCLRHRGDVLMGRCCYVFLRRRHDVPITRRGKGTMRRLGDVLPRRRWVFHLGRTYDVAETYKDTTSYCRVGSNVKLTLSSISNSLPFWSGNSMIISSNSVLLVFQKH